MAQRMLFTKLVNSTTTLECSVPGNTSVEFKSVVDDCGVLFYTSADADQVEVLIQFVHKVTQPAPTAKIKDLVLLNLP